MILSWVSREARPISLRQLMVFGRSLTEARLISSANYVRTELPTRLGLSCPSNRNINADRSMLGSPIAYVTCRHCPTSL